ncbi:MAG: hypothetical protein ACHQ50_00960 [Fimbriimonadales bacterium]
MSDVARWLARIVWWSMMRFMRIPWVRRMRRRWLAIVPASTARRMIRQDRFARRHGQAVLAFSLTLLLASMAITGCYFLALEMVGAGVLPKR